MKNITALVLACILTGCTSTGVVPMGSDTFMVSRKGSAYSSVGSLKAECLKEANAFCASKGLVMVPVSATGNPPGFGVMGSCELVFRAMTPEEAAKVQPDISQKQVIELRKR